MSGVGTFLSEAILFMLGCEREVSNFIQTNPVWIGTACVGFIMGLAGIGPIIAGTFLKAFSDEPKPDNSGTDTTSGPSR